MTSSSEDADLGTLPPPPIAVAATNTEIPFVANRPDVQDKVNAAHERLGLVTAYLRDAVRETLNYRKAGLAMAKASEDLANFLMYADHLEAPPKAESFSDESRGDSGNWGGGVNDGAGSGGVGSGSVGGTPAASGDHERDKLLGSLTPVLMKFGRLLKEQASAQHTYMLGLQKSFVEPMEAYTKAEYGRLADNKKAWEATEESYVASLEKYLHGPVKAKNLTDEIIDQRAAELAKAHHDAQQARFEIVRELSVAEGNKYLVVADCVLASVNVIDAHFRESTSIVETFSPYKNSLEDRTEHMRAALVAAEGPWDAQKAKLESAIALTKETLEVTSKAAGVANGGGGHSSNGAAPGLSRAHSSRGVFLKGLEGSKLTTAVRNASTMAESRHLCFDQMKKMEDVYSRLVTPGCVKEGYLFKRSSSKMLQHWNRRWFVLDGSKLYYLKDAASRQKMLICDVMLCTVKEVNSADALYCFEVFSANRRSYMLQAEGPDELKSWVMSIRRTIESQLTGSTPLTMTSEDSSGWGGGGERGITGAGGGGNTGGGAGGAGGTYVEDTSDEEPGHRDHGALSDAGRPHYNLLAQEVMSANPECADCGAPCPDWVSLNLGVLVCIQCSGIHRSLGTHVSKVRSLGLDALDEVSLSVLRDVGNAKSNGIWEHDLHKEEDWVKPGPDSAAEHKRCYIQAKYVWMGFVEGSPRREGDGDTRDDGGAGDRRSVGSSASARSSRVYGRRGGREASEEVSSSSSSRGVDASVGGGGGGGGGGGARGAAGKERWSLRLSECAAMGDLTGAVDALAHGGDPRWANPDDQQRTALHCAAVTGDLRCCEFLIQNGGDVSAKDAQDLQPLELALLENQVPVVEYLSFKLNLLR